MEGEQKLLSGNTSLIPHFLVLNLSKFVFMDYPRLESLWAVSMYSRWRRHIQCWVWPKDSLKRFIKKTSKQRIILVCGHISSTASKLGHSVCTRIKHVLKSHNEGQHGGYEIQEASMWVWGQLEDTWDLLTGTKKTAWWLKRQEDRQRTYCASSQVWWTGWCYKTHIEIVQSEIRTSLRQSFFSIRVVK